MTRNYQLHPADYVPSYSNISPEYTILIGQKSTYVLFFKLVIEHNFYATGLGPGVGNRSRGAANHWYAFAHDSMDSWFVAHVDHRQFSKMTCHKWNMCTCYVIILVQCNFFMIFQSVTFYVCCYMYNKSPKSVWKVIDLYIHVPPKVKL